MADERSYNETNPASALVRKLEQFGRLSDEERDLVEAASFSLRNIEADQDVARVGERLPHCPLLLEGFACHYRTLENGQRQIIAFLVPGDFCDLTSLMLRKLDYSIGTLTPAQAAFIPHATLLGWIKQYPSLGQLLWRATMVDAAMSREWVVNVGRRTAFQRTAHMLCELMLRMRVAGRARGLTCDMPLTQIELADALGLTPVHVNRTLQWLRGENLVEFGGGVLTVRNWRELKRAAGFDTTYLHQLAASG